jgi:D-tyrosyl-tRNA(Tyr) deacylase
MPVCQYRKKPYVLVISLSTTGKLACQAPIMRVLVQRVNQAHVEVDGQLKSKIGRGYLLLVGVRKDDTENDLTWMAQKVKNLRVFEDENGKMNLNLEQAGGEILSVPQFTICADMSKGNRPGFDLAAKPDVAQEFWQRFNTLLINEGLKVQKGVFGAHMAVTITNDGPVTIWLDSQN